MDNHYDPYKDYDEIIDPYYRELLNGEEKGIVFGDTGLSEEEAETGAVIVAVFSSLFLVAIIALSIYLIS